MPEPAQPEREPEREAEPGYRADVSERIDASIKHVQEAGERAAADSKRSSTSVPNTRRGWPRRPSTKPKLPVRGRPARPKTGQLRWSTSPRCDRWVTPTCGPGSSRSRGPTRSPARRLALCFRTPAPAWRPATLATSNAKYRYPPGASFTSAAVLCAVHPSPVMAARMNAPAAAIQLPGLMLGSSHSAALSEAFSSH